jgi:hypothetical protein
MQAGKTGAEAKTWAEDIKRGNKNKRICFTGDEPTKMCPASSPSECSAQSEHRLPGSNVQAPRNSLARYFRARQKRPGCQAQKNHADTKAHIGQDIIAFYRVDSIG